uniref:Uncharacterized protein n=1 Tax=Arion vulgaris TaxID=1028688 RepID=A0A0B7BLA1_9EUPU
MSGRSSKARQMEHIQNKITTYKHMQIPLHSIGPKGKSSSAAGSLKKYDVSHFPYQNHHPEFTVLI